MLISNQTSFPVTTYALLQKQTPVMYKPAVSTRSAKVNLKQILGKVWRVNLTSTQTIRLNRDGVWIENAIHSYFMSVKKKKKSVSYNEFPIFAYFLDLWVLRRIYFPELMIKYLVDLSDLKSA